MNMTSKYNPFQVICIGDSCKIYGKCDNKCILKDTFKKYLKGCNYSQFGDCKYCSHKKTCVLIKPYSNKLYETEMERFTLEKENETLKKYISTWDEIERELDKYEGDSVTDVIYFERSKQQMIERINDNKKLIKAYLKKEGSLVKDMV